MALPFLWSQTRLLEKGMVGLQLLRVMDRLRKEKKEIVKFS